MTYNEVNNLLNERNLFGAEKYLSANKADSAEWHYFYSKLLLLKAWFDGAQTHLTLAVEMAPENSFYKEELVHLMSRHRRYSDPYHNGGYRRHRGCACCCCDDCCCDCNFSCCDLICLDSCCECMGGDLIDCI